MKTGDKVRFLRSKEEGRVKKMLEGNVVEVEIEDGFVIPVMKSEIVVVSEAENEIFQRPSKESSPTFSLEKEKGLLFALVPFNDQIHSVYMVNTSGQKILLSYFEETKEDFKGIYAGILEPGKSEKVQELRIADFDKWPTFQIQALYFHSGKTIYTSPLNRKLKLKAAQFFKPKKNIPVLNKEGFYLQLDEDLVKIVPEEIAEKLIESRKPEASDFERPEAEIDLHIEKLVKDHKKMSAAEMLDLQMITFRNNLEKALATGMEEIIFIHGVGNGVLKAEIHRELSKQKQIKYFKEAKKEKFGYGATLVRLK